MKLLRRKIDVRSLNGAKNRPKPSNRMFLSVREELFNIDAESPEKTELGKSTRFILPSLVTSGYE